MVKYFKNIVLFFIITFSLLAQSNKKITKKNNELSSIKSQILDLEKDLKSKEADEVATRLVEAILASEIVQGINGELLAKFLEFKIYELLTTIGNDINAIESIEIELISLFK